MTLLCFLIDVFPNDQLAGGNMSKGVEMIADGAVDLAAYAAGVMAVLDEHLLIGSTPWTFNNYQEARRIIDLPDLKFACPAVRCTSSSGAPSEPIPLP